MAKKKEQSKSSKTFWRIAISAVGIALILMGVANLMLFIFGESTTAKITTRRYGGVVNNSSVDQRYEWSVDFTFKDKDGQTHSGHTTRRGNDMSINVENKVYYFPFAPFVNSLKSQAEPNIGQPVLIGIGIFLLLVMNRKNKKQSSGFKSVTTRGGEKEVPNLDDYDDSVEEVFHENTDE